MEGPWITAPKTPESTDKPGKSLTLIHDDDVAKSLGYQGGFVGGSTVMAITSPAIFASFGHNWYESGVYSARLSKPVFTGDEVRVIWEESEPDPGDKRKITFCLEKRDGLLTTFGWAALGEPGQKLKPPWERYLSPPAESADDLVPEMQVGDRYPDFDCCMTKDRIIPKFDGIHDYNWWYRVASPWGDPIVPPSELGIMALTGAVERTGDLASQRLQNSMWTGFEAVVYGPVFVGHNYHFQSWLCEKGKTARSVFFTTELTMDDEDGRRVAIFHHKSRHLISDIGDIESKP
jgi:hypothetical protein